MDLRLFVTKKPQYRVESESLASELRQSLHLPENFDLQIYNIYDIFNADQEDIELLKKNILAEPVTDIIETPDLTDALFIASEYLPGQYDQRADSAMQCLMLLNGKTSVRIHSGTLLLLENADAQDIAAIEHYCINPVESRPKDLNILEDDQDVTIEPVPVISGFITMDEAALSALHASLGLAMSLEDLTFVQTYFRDEEKRDPTMTEIRVLDTYWSDHCRHTTFETILENVTFDGNRLESQLQASYENYLSLRQTVHHNSKPQTLMDMATIAGKYLRTQGKLDDMEVSDEINACSIEITVDTNGKEEPWLLMFKNETHNHPTEIEPFGGAATCIGGAIRDPLSGRSYVYQAMRITGAGDITRPVEDTLEHKLPQTKISKTAAKGYSSYGNQIGLATTYVEELYNEGYTAKRMEVGAVIGAAPKANIRRETPVVGDIVVLVGGATGRDGIGGATGSSKEHNDTSLEKCSSEVQKGNALTERKLQRLFRNPEASLLMKKSNDFGAGGVSVAIGELADSLDIDLDTIPVKYEGLDGTELAISESQERMAAVIDPHDLARFSQLCQQENLTCVKAAQVTDTGRLVMRWQGKTIVDMSRAFLNTNGIRQHQNVHAGPSQYSTNPFETKETDLVTALAEPNTACQIGLAEMFDASIGKSTVLMPFGGKNQHTPEEGSVQKLPTEDITHTVSVMTYGFDPETAEYSPYLGAAYSVVEALARQTALGADPFKARLSNQEYFERLAKDPDKWGRPFEALLGLIDAQLAFETPAIGGKDSMSGTFNDIHVPPTLITFAVTTAKDEDIISAELKEAGHNLYLLRHTPNPDKTPDYSQLKSNFAAIRQHADHIVAAKSVKNGGIASTLAMMAFGNDIGAEISVPDPCDWNIGTILVETDTPIDDPRFEKIGTTLADPMLIVNGETVPLSEAFAAWTSRYDPIYPRHAKGAPQPVFTMLTKGAKTWSRNKVDHPVVVIPVFPGQNCELDTARQFRRAGGDVHEVVMNNQTVENLETSIATLADEIANAQILMLVGGFSSGDEPDGSGKFIANVLKNPKIWQAIQTMRANDGLILGICNGFQALVKSGLLPYGNVLHYDENSPTLFRNDINRHVSRMATTRISSNRSPWLQNFEPGHTHTIAFSHGEGKFMADEKTLDHLEQTGAIATQYTDPDGNPTMDGRYNINGSARAIEGILNEDGHIFGKMGHSERWEPGLFQNIDGDLDQNIFLSGIQYFTHEGRD